MIVETGEGLKNSDSYVDVDVADTYFASRGNIAWSSLSQEAKESALINATDFVDNVFRWKGVKSTSEQALRFPRKNLIDIDGYEVRGVPNVLKQAVCDAAFISSTGKTLFQTSEANGAVVSEKIGELAFTYDISKKKADQTLYDAINMKLRGLYVNTSGGSVFIGGIERS